MGPIRRRKTDRYFNPELFENWSVDTLKQHLIDRGVENLTKAKRMQFVPSITIQKNKEVRKIRNKVYFKLGVYRIRKCEIPEFHAS